MVKATKIEQTFQKAQQTKELNVSGKGIVNSKPKAVPVTWQANFKMRQNKFQTTTVELFPRERLNKPQTILIDCI